jgi:stage V sporulation protein R
MNEIAAYGGFPNRFPHWRYGMEYERLAKSYEYGLSKIYEMVINNNPSYAYLLEGNSLTDQKLVMAHVYGHVDFFKNNFTFQSTNQGLDPRTGQPLRKWIDTMANHGAIVRRWANRIGIDKIEEFIDTCLSLENLIDVRKPFAPADKGRAEKKSDDPYAQDRENKGEEIPLLRVDREYMQSYINPDEFVEKQRKKMADEKAKEKRVPESPERDVMGFLIEHAPLERWERDVLNIIREEAYYFLPQMQTKIMNEGWATYWHSKIMTEKAAHGSEIIDYADRCAGVLATSRDRLNPYKLGVELYRHIEERWNRGQFGKEWDECDSMELKRNWDRRTGLGRQRLFEVRKLYNDITFIDEFFTLEFCVEQKFYSFGFSDRSGNWEIMSREFKKVKDQLLRMLTNRGQPVIVVAEGNFENRSELLLRHVHEGTDLDAGQARDTLRNASKLWTRPVSLLTKVENKGKLLRCEDGNLSERSAEYS